MKKIFSLLVFLSLLLWVFALAAAPMAPLMAAFSLDVVLAAIAALVGVPMAVSLIIDILKWAGVVQDGDAGKWNAGFNLVILLVVAALFQFLPSFDLQSFDAQLVEFVKLAAMIFAYVVEIAGAKFFHRINPKAFSHGAG